MFEVYDKQREEHEMPLKQSEKVFVSYLGFHAPSNRRVDRVLFAFYLQDSLWFIADLEKSW